MRGSPELTGHMVNARYTSAAISREVNADHSMGESQKHCDKGRKPGTEGDHCMVPATEITKTGKTNL